MPRRGPPIENPEAIGEVTDPAFVRLPDQTRLFADRAERLRALAPDHVLGAYLLFLADVVDAQHAASRNLPPPLAAEEIEMRIGAAMPPLAPDLVLAGDGFTNTLNRFLDSLTLSEAPAAAQAAGA